MKKKVRAVWLDREGEQHASPRHPINGRRAKTLQWFVAETQRRAGHAWIEEAIHS